MWRRQPTPLPLGGTPVLWQNTSEGARHKKTLIWHPLILCALTGVSSIISYIVIYLFSRLKFYRFQSLLFLISQRTPSAPNILVL